MGVAKEGSKQIGHSIQTYIRAVIIYDHQTGRANKKLQGQASQYEPRVMDGEGEARTCSQLGQVQRAWQAAKGWQATRCGRLGDARTKCEYL